MKIVLTGSLGNISRPLAELLLKQNHTVTVISSNRDKVVTIEALGATAAIGTVSDVEFLTHTFKGADVVYCMIPPGNYLDPNVDMGTHYASVGNNYAQAILQAGVRRVIHLSSIGGDMASGNGLLKFHHYVETALRKLPENVTIITMRPTAFYHNLFAFVKTIKTNDAILANYGGDDICSWVSPLDIANAVAEEIAGDFSARKIRYVASEEISCNEIAAILGSAIGKPELKWNIISDEQMLGGLKAAGINQTRAQGVVEMNACIHSGKLFEDYNRNKPVLGKTKLKDFAPEFAFVYNK